MQRQLCDLQTNYLDVLTKYKNLLSQVQAGTLSVKDFASQLDQLQSEINDLSSGNCKNLGQSTKADALIICSQGQQKAIPAPSLFGQGLCSFQDTDGNWKFKLAQLGLIRQVVQVGVLATGNQGAGSHDFPVTLPAFPAFTQQCWGCFGVNLVGSPSGGNGSTNLSMNGTGMGHTGPNAEDNQFDIFVQLAVAAVDFNLSSQGAIFTMSANVVLKFYDYR
jgi:hypothetical protein